MANAIAAGLMLGASHGLISEGLRYSLGRLVIGVVLGLIFMVVAYRFLEGREDSMRWS